MKVNFDVVRKNIANAYNVVANTYDDCHSMSDEEMAQLDILRESIGVLLLLEDDDGGFGSIFDDVNLFCVYDKEG